jgi:hypothetical protein
MLEVTLGVVVDDHFAIFTDHEERLRPGEGPISAEKWR